MIFLTLCSVKLLAAPTILMIGNFDYKLSKSPKTVDYNDLAIGLLEEWNLEKTTDLTVRRVHTETLGNLTEDIQKSIHPSDKIIGIFFLGHGRAGSFKLNEHSYYTGEDFSAPFNDFLNSNTNISKKLFVYFNSCFGACETKKGDSLLQSFLKNIKNSNYKIYSMSHTYFSHSDDNFLKDIPKSVHKIKLGEKLSKAKNYFDIVLDRFQITGDFTRQLFVPFAPLLGTIGYQSISGNYDYSLMSMELIFALTYIRAEYLLHKIIVVGNNQNLGSEETTLNRFLNSFILKNKCSFFFGS